MSTATITLFMAHRAHNTEIEKEERTPGKFECDWILKQCMTNGLGPDIRFTLSDLGIVQKGLVEPENNDERD
ncbi:unnamed protein product [Haemonchus placei]|uniref:Uncharacterized protein n=1 Tax=Haemonchus placei TaxID=6290 RepID=A0A0N4VUP7_HAEPC|nr:unnamed protein product [Haemonchus placei]